MLRTLVSVHPSLAEELPVIHTSRCGHLGSIAATHSLTPFLCPLFKESLIYLFYGRPAYRSKRGGRAGEPIALCPICFVFKPRTVSGQVKRAIICDSGTVLNDVFRPEIAAADLPELELDPQIESARRAVSMLFERNHEYFLGKVVLGKTFPAGSSEARFYALLQRSGPADYDDRKSAIEIQVDRPISLRDQLLFVVLPREFFEDEPIRDAVINVWNCDPVMHATFQGSAPAEYYAVVRQEVTRRFQEATRI